MIVVLIPRSVTSIDDLAFYNGDVVSITYEGTIDEWKAIVKGETWVKGVRHVYIECVDGMASRRM